MTLLQGAGVVWPGARSITNSPPVVVEKREVHRRDLRRGGNRVVTGQEGRRTKDEGQRFGILKVEAFLYIGATFVFRLWSFVHDGSQLGQGWRYLHFQICRQQCLEVGEQAARLRRKPREPYRRVAAGRDRAGMLMEVS